MDTCVQTNKLKAQEEKPVTVSYNMMADRASPFSFSPHRQCGLTAVMSCSQKHYKFVEQLPQSLSPYSFYLFICHQRGPAWRSFITTLAQRRGLGCFISHVITWRVRRRREADKARAWFRAAQWSRSKGYECKEKDRNIEKTLK